jgi:hypothetical protein
VKTGVAPLDADGLVAPVPGALLKSPLATTGEFVITYTRNSTTAFTIGVTPSAQVVGSTTTGVDNADGCKKAP